MVSRRELIGRMSAVAFAATATDACAQTGTAPASPLLAAKLPGITLPAGKHNVSANITVRADLLLMPGATIEIAAGRTLTLLGDFQAPVAHVFTGPGRVDLTGSRAPAAYPEWWGAARDDSSRDSLPALRDIAPDVHLWQPAQGGHVGFPSGAPPGHLGFLPQQVLRWFQSLS
jgi:hypothetical protein